LSAEGEEMGADIHKRNVFNLEYGTNLDMIRPTQARVNGLLLEGVNNPRIDLEG
jgi:hypothetical protein